MEAHVKAGQVYLQPRKSGKKWKQVWLSLYSPSRRGVGRLEIQDTGVSGGGAGGEWTNTVLGAGVRRHHQPHGDRKLKVVRLSEVISVLRLPPHAEACPKENMSAFCVETEERTMVFAAVKEECVEWVERVCDIAFQRGSACVSSPQPHMKENQIYERGEVCEFLVVVQQTDAATRCGLQGACWLQVAQEGLILKEAEKNRCSIWGWPYRLLRRYGKDKLTITIEAGRRCNSGPGTFTFETGQANEIFSLIENAIKQQRASPTTASNHPTVTMANQNQEGERVVLANRLPRSPLPKIPDMTTMAAILENKLKVAGSEESMYAKPVDLIGPSECVYAIPADSIGSSLDETVYSQPMDRISYVPHTPSVSHLGCQSEPLYADPVDCIQSVPKPVLEVTTGVYKDPASILPLKPPTSTTTAEPPHPPPHSSSPHSNFHGDHPDPIYSEVYDKVRLLQNRQDTNQNQEEGKNCFADDEPIYVDPTKDTEGVFGKNAAKPDPFAHLYAQVCKPTPSLSSSTSPSSCSENIISSFPCSSSASNITPSSSSVTVGTTAARDQSLSDVIYENLGVI
ncbi:docking protein 1 [Polymixia lowei]